MSLYNKLIKGVVLSNGQRISSSVLESQIQLIANRDVVPNKQKTGYSKAGINEFNKIIVNVRPSVNGSTVSIINSPAYKADHLPIAIKGLLLGDINPNIGDFSRQKHYLISGTKQTIDANSLFLSKEMGINI
jgi:hypothetical protein